MKKILYFLLFIVSFTSCADGIKLKGAFGVDFGSTLSDDEMGNCYTLSCIISPPTPYIIFSNYLVSLSPFKKRVFRIHGSGSTSSNSECIEHANKIIRDINRKYNVQLEKIEHKRPDGTFITLWTTYIGKRARATGIWAFAYEENRKKIDLTCKDNSQLKGLESFNKSYMEQGLHTLKIKKHTISISYTNFAVLANEKLMGMADEQGL